MYQTARLTSVSAIVSRISFRETAQWNWTAANFDLRTLLKAFSVVYLKELRSLPTMTFAIYSAK